MANDFDEILKRIRQIERVMRQSQLVAQMETAARMAQQVQRSVGFEHATRVAQQANDVVRANQAAVAAVARRLEETQAQIRKAIGSDTILQNVRKAEALAAAHAKQAVLKTGMFADLESRVSAMVGSPKALAGLSESIRSALEVTRPIAERISGLLQGQLLHEFALPSLSLEAVRVAARAYNSVGARDVLGHDSTLANALSEFRFAVESRSSQRLDEALDRVGVGIQEAIDNQSDSVLQLFWRKYAVEILLFVLSILHTEVRAYFSAADVERSDKKVLSKIEVLNEGIDDLAAVPDEYREYGFYGVDREVPLMQKPRPNGVVLQWVGAGELLVVLERKGRWVRVEYFDPKGGPGREGWIRKKFLSR